MRNTDVWVHLEGQCSTTIYLYFHSCCLRVIKRRAINTNFIRNIYMFVQRYIFLRKLRIYVNLDNTKERTSCVFVQNRFRWSWLTTKLSLIYFHRGSQSRHNRERNLYKNAQKLMREWSCSNTATWWRCNTFLDELIVALVFFSLFYWGKRYTSSIVNESDWLNIGSQMAHITMQLESNRFQKSIFSSYAEINF